MSILQPGSILVRLTGEKEIIKREEVPADVA